MQINDKDIIDSSKVKHSKIRLIAKIWGLPFLVYGIAMNIIIYVFQNSDLATNYFGISEMAAGKILDGLMAISFILVWRVILLRYAKFSQQELNKRHWLNWKIVAWVIVAGYLTILTLWLMRLYY